MSALVWTCGGILMDSLRMTVTLLRGRRSAYPERLREELVIDQRVASFAPEVRYAGKSVFVASTPASQVERRRGSVWVEASDRRGCGRRAGADGGLRGSSDLSWATRATGSSTAGGSNTLTGGSSWVGGRTQAGT